MPKLTYEQMRHLSELGAPEGRLVLKNRKGVNLKSQLSKWGPSRWKPNPRLRRGRTYRTLFIRGAIS